jgi:EthD domain
LIVITFLLRRRPELSAAEFHEYWRDRHGPLVASQAGALGIRRYIQLHLTDSPPALQSRNCAAARLTHWTASRSSGSTANSN